MKKSRMFWGTLFIVCAFLLIVTQLGIWEININIWTLLLTIFFGVTAIWSLFHKRPTGMLFSLAFLAILYDKSLGIEAITPWTVLLAALLASIGCHILFQPKTKKKYHETFRDKETIKGEKIYIDGQFGTYMRYIDSQNIQSVYIKNMAGVMKVYFDHADVQGQSFDVQIDATCAMLEIYIPATWKVIDQTDVMLSHLEMDVSPQSLITHQMILKGKVNLSEIKIISV